MTAQNRKLNTSLNRRFFMMIETEAKKSMNNYDAAIMTFKNAFKEEIMEIYGDYETEIDNQPGYVAKFKQNVQRKAVTQLVSTTVEKVGGGIGALAGKPNIGAEVGGLAAVAVKASSFIYFHIKDKQDAKELNEAQNFARHLKQLGGKTFVEEAADYLANRFLFAVRELWDMKSNYDIVELALFFTAALAKVLLKETSSKAVLQKEQVFLQLMPDLEDELFKHFLANKKLKYEKWTIKGLLHRAPVCTAEGDFLTVKDKKHDRSDKYPPQRTSHEEAMQHGYGLTQPLFASMQTSQLGTQISSLSVSDDNNDPSANSYKVFFSKLDLDPSDINESDLQSRKKSLDAFKENKEYEKNYNLNLAQDKVIKEIRVKRKELVNTLETYENKSKNVDKDLAKKVYEYMHHLFLRGYHNYVYRQFMPDLTEVLFFAKETEWLVKLANACLRIKDFPKEDNVKLGVMVENLKRMKVYLLASFYLYAPEKKAFGEIAEHLGQENYLLIVKEYKSQLANLGESCRNALLSFNQAKQDSGESAIKLRTLLKNIEDFIKAKPVEIIMQYEKNSATVINILANTRSELENLIKDMLFGYVMCGDAESVKTLLENYSQFVKSDAKNSKGFTALHEACVWGHQDVFSVLMKEAKLKKLDLTKIISDDGSTLLHSAAFGCHDNMVQILLAEGIAINSCNLKTTAGNASRTALHNAAVAINLQKAIVIKTLLGCGAKVNVQDGDGATPLHLLFLNRNIEEFKAVNREVVQLLFDKGAELNVIDSQKCTPLHRLLQTALRSQKLDVEIIQFLIEKGAHIQVADNRNKTPLDYMKDYRKKMEDKLKISQADPDAIDDKEVTRIKEELKVVGELISVMEERIKLEKIDAQSAEDDLNQADLESQKPASGSEKKCTIM